MTLNVYGNILLIELNAGDKTTMLELPDGYTIAKAHVILSNASIATPMGTNLVNNDNMLSFPIVNGRSPSLFRFGLVDSTKSGTCKIMIDKFGSRADSNYFSKAFEPILVYDEKGSEYNLIPQWEVR